MNKLHGLNTNTVYHKKPKKHKDDPDVFEKFTELIFILERPSYGFKNDGTVIRERAIEECRFTVSNENLETLGKTILALKDIDDEDAL